MAIRICPRCHQAFYIVAGNDFYSCYHCEYSLLSRRSRGRKNVLVDFTFLLGKKKMPAMATDYSHNGVQIRYKGQPLPFNTFIYINIDELNIQKDARAVWTKKIGRGKFIAGLKFSYKR